MVLHLITFGRGQGFLCLIIYDILGLGGFMPDYMQYDVLWDSCAQLYMKPWLWVALCPITWVMVVWEIFIPDYIWYFGFEYIYTWSNMGRCFRVFMFKLYMGFSVWVDFQSIVYIYIYIYFVLYFKFLIIIYNACF